MSKNDKPETKVVSEGRMSAEHFGVVNTPVYRASTILYPDLKALKAKASLTPMAGAARPAPQSLEDAISRTGRRGQDRCWCRRACRPLRLAILSVCGAGDHFWWRTAVYEPTRISATRTLMRFGVETSYYAPGADIAPCLKPNTRAVFCESPGSLTFEVQDIAAVATRPRMRMAPPC